MSDPTWQTIKTISIPARPKHGYWTLALEYVVGSQRLKFVVEDTEPANAAPVAATASSQAGTVASPAPVQTANTAPLPGGTPTHPAPPPPSPASPGPKWSYAAERRCGADGDPKAPFNSATCLIADAPPGALIAKIGGSTAGKADGAKLFIVGSYCVVELDDKTKGPLFMSMNFDPMSSLERSGALEVTISQSA
jgi:hypothetical protein